MKSIKKFEYQCFMCKHKFYAPMLSDFSYGEFILWSSSGEFRYLNALEDKTYKEVINLITDNKFSHFLDVQKIYGELVCDRDYQKNYFYIEKHFCPKCGSDDISLLEGDTNSYCHVFNVEHVEWDSLTENEKIDRFIALANRINV